MEWIETTGRTIEDAKEEALDQLEIDEAELDFEILEEPKTGLFGRQRGEARIRARVVPKAPRAKQERRPRKQRAPRKEAAERAPKAEKADQTDQADGSEDSEPDASAPAAKGAPRKRGGGRSRSGGSAGGTSADNQEGKGMSDDVVPVGTQADMVTEFLEGLLGALGAEGTVTRNEIDDETIELSVDGPDLGVLIGPKGQTLTAVHELSRTVLQRRATGRHEGRVRIDIGGYRHRRQEALARFVTQQAEGVLAEGTARALESMNAADRKVVHDTVNDIEGVVTVSEGADPDRRVVIVPEGADA